MINNSSKVLPKSLFCYILLFWSHYLEGFWSSADTWGIQGRGVIQEIWGIWRQAETAGFGISKLFLCSIWTIRDVLSTNEGFYPNRAVWEQQWWELSTWISSWWDTLPPPCHRAPSSWRGVFQGISLPGNPRAVDQAFQPWSIQQATGPVTLRVGRAHPGNPWRWEEKSTTCPIKGNGLEMGISWSLLPLIPHGYGCSCQEWDACLVLEEWSQFPRCWGGKSGGKDSKLLGIFGFLTLISPGFSHCLPWTRIPGTVPRWTHIKPLDILHERRRSMGMIPFLLL